MSDVIKMDGRKEKFIREKIIVSCVKTGAPIDIARKIADIVEKEIKSPIKTEEIKRIVLRELARRDKEWADNWYLYDKAVKKRIVEY
jgi:transcriptional repressor NrdR